MPSQDKDSASKDLSRRLSDDLKRLQEEEAKNPSKPLTSQEYERLKRLNDERNLTVEK